MTKVSRLIEVDLPIKKISAHARREKSIRHGHISTLHIWWARRPLAACRAIILAALWPDPADPSCPEKFKQEAARLMKEFRDKRGGKLRNWDNPFELRGALLDFIADFADWNNSTSKDFLDVSQTLVQVAHECLGGAPGTKPLVVDPFAGGGSIPLEALRVGADAFASDLNPVAVLLNKVILEYIPKYGQHLADEVRKWGAWIKKQSESELDEFYPEDKDGATPIAYLWARKVQCEGPGCGAEIPLIRSLWLAKKTIGSVALQLVSNEKTKRVDFQIIIKQNHGWVDQANPKIKIENPKFEGTVKRGSATCPCCGYTTPVARIREQLKQQSGGADSSRLMCVVLLRNGAKVYRQVIPHDLVALQAVHKRFKRNTILPPQPLPLMSGVFNVPIYGMNRWDLLFSIRQLGSAQILSEKLSGLDRQITDAGLRIAVKVLLAIAIDKYLDFRTTLCGWISTGEKIGHTFSRQALGMIFDWVEGTCFGDVSGSWERNIGFLS